MKYKLFILMIVIGSHLSLSQSLNDFFPLKIGNQWNYSYKSVEKQYYDISFIGNQMTTDSGRINYNIISNSLQDSIILWNVQESDSVIRRVRDYSHNTDTSFSINVKAVFQLCEHLNSLHTIESQSNYEIFTYPVKWSGFGNMSSTIPINRFSQDSSIIVIKEDTFSIARFSDSLSFQKNIGLVYARSIINKGPNTPYYYEWQASLTSIITSVKDNRNEFPKEYLSLQNYPNPFNPTTIISFQLSHKSHVIVNILDILGRNIACLIDFESGSGNHNTHWDASNHASGIYFCRLQTDGFTETIKIVLLK